MTKGDDKAKLISVPLIYCVYTIRKGFRQALKEQSMGDNV